MHRGVLLSARHIGKQTDASRLVIVSVSRQRCNMASRRRLARHTVLPVCGVVRDAEGTFSRKRVLRLSVPVRQASCIGYTAGTEGCLRYWALRYSSCPSSIASSVCCFRQLDIRQRRHFRILPENGHHGHAIWAWGNGTHGGKRERDERQNGEEVKTASGTKNGTEIAYPDYGKTEYKFRFD